MPGPTRDTPQELAVQQYLRGEHTRHIRFEQLLARWPVLDQDWARRVEQRRIDSRDTTPGAATFGR